MVKILQFKCTRFVYPRAQSSDCGFERFSVADDRKMRENLFAKGMMY